MILIIKYELDALYEHIPEDVRNTDVLIISCNDYLFYAKG